MRVLDPLQGHEIGSNSVESDFSAMYSECSRSCIGLAVSDPLMGARYLELSLHTGGMSCAYRKAKPQSMCAVYCPSSRIVLVIALSIQHELCLATEARVKSMPTVH